MMVAVYPTVRDNPDLNKLVESYPEALKAFIAFGGSVDYASGAGYLGSELFSFMVPLLLMVAAIGAGRAGDRRRGGARHARPAAREPDLAAAAAAREARRARGGDRRARARALARAARRRRDRGDGRFGGAPRGGDGVGRAAGDRLRGDRDARRRAERASRRGDRRLGRAGVASYLVNSLAALVDFLEPFRQGSPFYHYVASDPLRHGLELGHTAFLVGLALVAAVAAVVAFDRRDLAS